MNNYNNIFTDDVLHIANQVVSFAKLIEQDKFVKTGGTSKVYSISAEFGIGKTFFCDKLKLVLDVDKIPNVKMNIWEIDFYEDPMIPILAELNKLYNPSNKINESLPTDVVKHKNRWWKCLSGEVGVNTGLSHLKIGVNLSKIETNDNNKITIYDDYNEYVNEFIKLKTAIENWTKKLDKPVVIIIDELDRCRPDYAVKTLEIMKHFFNISGIVFVLSLDEEQLKNSVKCLFGTENFDGYKRKFISNSFVLQKPDYISFATMLYDKFNLDKQISRFRDKEVLIPNIKERIDENNFDASKFVRLFNPDGHPYLLNNENSRNNILTPTSKEVIIKYFATYSDIFNFSLRKQEQVFDRIAMFIKSLSDEDWFVPYLFILLACIHEYDIKKYRDFINSPQTYPLDKLEPKYSEALNNISGVDYFRFVNKISYSQTKIEKTKLFFDEYTNQRLRDLGYSNFLIEDLLKIYSNKIEFLANFDKMSF